MKNGHQRDSVPELVPAQNFTFYFVGAQRPGGGIDRLSRDDVDPRVAFERLKWLRRRRPNAQVFKRSIFDSLVREAI